MYYIFHLVGKEIFACVFLERQQGNCWLAVASDKQWTHKDAPGVLFLNPLWPYHVLSTSFQRHQQS